MTLPKPYYEDQKRGIVIYHAPCEEVLPELGDVNLVVTDPPYEIVATGGGIGRDRQYLSDISGFTDVGFDMDILDRFANWSCFCSKTQLPKLIKKAEIKPRWMLVTWNKPNPTPLCNGNYLPDTEYVVHAFQSGRCFGDYKSKSRFIVYPAQQGLYHPNENPVSVISKMIVTGSQEGETICDPYCGSGTTLVAAKRLGRKAIGIEIEERYCEIAAERLEREDGYIGKNAEGEKVYQGSLFDE